MINHIVMFKFESRYSESEIEAALNQLAVLQTMMLSFSLGKNMSPEHLNQGFTHAFVMTFRDAQIRDAYLEHPEHKRIATEVLIPMLEDGINSVIVVDYEFAS